MSRYFGLGWPSGKHGRAAESNINEKTQINKSGSKWRGGDRQWGRSLMDQGEYSRMTNDYWNKYSTGPGTQAGVYNLKVVDDSGTAMKEAVINIGGKLFRSSKDNGQLRILDSEFLNSEIAAYKEVRDYETRIVQAIIVSDETADLIIGGTHDDVQELLEVGGGHMGKAIRVDGLTGELNVDARPSNIRYLDPSGSKYAAAIAKIRVIVSYKGIIVNQEGGELQGAGLGIRETSDRQAAANK
jgi:hypothetical protein